MYLSDDDNDDKDFHIPRSDELAHFIKYANGVHDLDFRHSGIWPWEPVPPMRMEIREYAYPDRPAVQALPPPDIAKAREELKESLEDSLLEENWIWGHCGYDFEVKVGFHTGLGSRIEHDAWYSTYMYCRRFEDDPDPSYKDWAWRVVILSADIMNPTTLYGRMPTFDSIPEFLDWYSSWYDHLDLRQLRRHIAEDRGDYDYESEPEV